MSAQTTRAGAGPASASSVDYFGSRLLKQRYAYFAGSRAGFAELSPARVMSGDQLFAALGKAPGVTHVGWQTAKYAQGNASASHYMQDNILAR